MSVDNMDNGKTSIPRLHRYNKDTDGKERLGTHLTGILLHGRPNPIYAYTWYERFPAGSDSVVTILARALNETVKDKPLPPTLYLHLDNCWRENKNRYVVSFLHLLVDKGVFDKIKLGFLPVGHTHDDVDQFFSKINAVLLRTNIFTIDDLHDTVRKSFLPVPVCSHIETMGMFAPWLEQYIENQWKGISKPHCFLFKRTASGRVGHYFRNQMQTSKKVNQDCWAPNTNSGLQAFQDTVFDSDNKLVVDFDSVICVPLKPVSYIKLRETVDTMKDSMTLSQLQWWRDTLRRMEEEDNNACSICTNFREVLGECVSSKRDSKEVRKAKNAKYKATSKELKMHVINSDTPHARFDETWFPPSRNRVRADQQGTLLHSV